MVRRIVVIVLVTLAVEVLLIAGITMNRTLPGDIRPTNIHWPRNLVATPNDSLRPSETSYAFARGRFWLSQIELIKGKPQAKQLDYLICHMTTDCLSTAIVRTYSGDSTHWLSGRMPRLRVVPGRRVVMFYPCRTLLDLSLWPLAAVLMIYPTLAFIRGPVRRWRRRRKGWCVQCGYDLTGNVTGMCPECGRQA